jgi:hypothetical protein
VKDVQTIYHQTNRWRKDANGAKSQKAPRSEQREVPNGAPTTLRRLRAVWHSA